MWNGDDVDSNEEELLILLALNNNKKKKKWTHEMNTQSARDNCGEFNRLCRELEKYEDRIMTKNKQLKSHSNKKPVKSLENKKAEISEAPVKTDSLEDEDQGFGGWLRSADGMDTMKLFVLANSIVMLTTIAFPHIQTMFSIISEIIYEQDEFH